VPRFDSFATGPTRVVVGRDLLDDAARAVAREHRGRAIVVVSDARVARLHGRRFARALSRRGARTLVLTFPAGERSKTRETKARLEDRLAAEGIGRDTVIVALGGGVTGDLAGFLAATWHRGIPVVQIPTTSLAMLDAALGGKTGVDLPAGKNLVGAFHAPAALWADVAVLGTLPARAFRAGLAEAVKMAAALDATLFRRLEASAAALLARESGAIGHVVSRCLRLKAAVVARDERDQGRRAVLNFGHTAAHALETASGYAIPHGEAVAIGLVAESRLAVRKTGFPREDAERIEALLEALALPTRAPAGIRGASLTAAMRRDKKSRGGLPRCALPERLGRMLRGDDPTLPVDPSRDLVPFLSRH